MAPMDAFTSERVAEVVDAIKTHCLRPTPLLGSRLSQGSTHPKWALPVLHVPFFSNTFVAGYLYAEALKKLLGYNQTAGEIPDGQPIWIRELIVAQEWSSNALQVLSQFRFNIFFTDRDAHTPDTNHLIPGYVARSDCFSYLHTAAFTDSEFGFAEIIKSNEPLMIVTDIPAEAAKVKAYAARVRPTRKVTVAKLGARSVGSVLSDPIDDAAVRLFFFGSPKTELFKGEIGSRGPDRLRYVVDLANEMRLDPVKTDLAIHFKYAEDSTHAKQFLAKFANAVQKCIHATDPRESVYAAAGPFFTKVTHQYNRLARSVAVGDHIPDRIVQQCSDSNGYSPTARFYVESIANHAA